MAKNTKPAEPVTVARICARHGIPDQAAGLIREGATLEQVRERADAAGAIRERVQGAINCGMVSEARAQNMGESAIQRGQSADQVSRALLNAAVDEQSPEDAVQGRITPDARVEDPSESPAAGWRHAAERVAQHMDEESGAGMGPLG